MDDLNQIFATLKPLLVAYKPPLASKHDEPGYYDLWSYKELVIEGRKRKEVYFAGLIIQKNYVGFYYMPVYTNPDIAGMFKQDLLKLLKGKSCFHIKKTDPDLIDQIEEVLASGFKLYQERGWV